MHKSLQILFLYCLGKHMKKMMFVLGCFFVVGLRASEKNRACFSAILDRVAMQADVSKKMLDTRAETLMEHDASRYDNLAQRLMEGAAMGVKECYGPMAVIFEVSPKQNETQCKAKDLVREIERLSGIFPLQYQIDAIQTAHRFPRSSKAVFGGNGIGLFEFGGYWIRSTIVA